jgi:dipeptidyl aminopeptidase/acylaminoacyl peptidase
MQPYLNVRGANLLDLRADASAALISTRFADVSQLHLVTEPLGMRKQITFFEEPVGGGMFVPGTIGQQIIYPRDEGGNEKDQFFRLQVPTSTSKMLTDPKGRYTSAVMTPDGQTLAFCGTTRTGRDWDIYTLNLADPNAKPELVWEVAGNFYPLDFSPDGQRLTILEYRSAADTAVHVLDITTGDVAQITPAEPKRYYSGGRWTADGNGIYLISDREGDFRRLYLLDMNYGEWRGLTPDIDWNVNGVAVEPTGAGIALTVNQNGRDRLYFADKLGQNRRPIDAVPLGRIGGLRFAPDGGTLGLTANNAQMPSDVFFLTYPAGEPTRWTASEVGGLDTSKFVIPELIQYPTFDQVDGQQRTIPAFYYKAPQPGPRPVVIYAHGGPESQFRPGFISTFQHWALELGVSVIAPNVRGSTGYGRDFHQLDNGYKREDSVKDIGALLDWIEKQPELDSSRVGIYGGSYGGYMVLGSLTMYPERFKAGICAVGIANFVTFLENTGDYRRDLRRREYGDETDPEMRAFLQKISPVNNAEKIKAALFITHGKNDPRVPYTEAEQIVAKMRELDRDVWYALALNEGHGYRKKENRDLIRVLSVAFWQQHLIE